MKLRIWRTDEIYLDNDGSFYIDLFLRGSTWLPNYLDELPLCKLIEWEGEILNNKEYLTYGQARTIIEIKGLIKIIKDLTKDVKKK